MITIIDYNMGNIRSVFNALGDLGAEVIVTNKKEDIDKADKIILPGVGAFGEGMDHLRVLGLVEVLDDNVMKRKKPFLGICLGMQLVADVGFEFGANKGLGWVSGEVKKLEVKNVSLPHIGWNDIAKKRDCPLLQNLPDSADFYFVHSYHVVPSSADVIAASCDYEGAFASVIHKENIYGVQFHPEKSQKAGKVLLENFIKI
ncbi:MAG: imidazole glycerol phosphate synthase subunit HisH [Candidatus Omnitrophica bacterium]|nr:imidazole glycerol phosphate synthase subunit HisH [Candidatus Omnitrophota bacterium]